MRTATAMAVGERYHFYQRNGQHILFAELVEESDNEYLVRLRYVAKPVRIAKRDLLRPPEPAFPNPADVAENSRIGIAGGIAAFTVGPLRPIFPWGYHAALRLNWLWPEKFFHIRGWALDIQLNFFYSQPRYVRQIGFGSGPQFLLFYWKTPAVAFTFTPLAGVSYTTLRGYTFYAEYATLSAAATFAAERRFARVWLGLAIFANYLYDPIVPFISSGIAIWAMYPLG